MSTGTPWVSPPSGRNAQTFDSPTFTGLINDQGGQIQFPATQNASSNVNTLDDYAEGTFTPGITFGGGSTGMAFTSQKGFYTKIGNRVMVNGIVQLSAKGTSTGTAMLTGLPFTSANITGNNAAAILRQANMTYTGQFEGYVSANSSSINLETVTEAGSGSVLADTNFTNTTQIIFQVTYAAAT